MRHALKHIGLPFVALFALLLTVSPASANRMDELKERFQGRHATLSQLKAAGKVGETSKGFAEAVQAASLNEKLSEEQTVGSFLAEENKDRQELYQIVARQQNVTPEVVAARNARRNFERAGPEEFLKLDDGRWFRKKDLPKE